MGVVRNKGKQKEKKTRMWYKKIKLCRLFDFSTDLSQTSVYLMKISETIYKT